VSLEAKLLFKTGSTFVEEEGKKALVELAKVLEHEKDIEIIVEGHTDTDKLASSTSPKNNWELSVLRSTSVVEIMTSNSKMNPAQLMAAGRSEFHPVDSQDKAKNRRIEIIISPNLNELFEIINK
jgi:chemotaxis protein MotB